MSRGCGELFLFMNNMETIRRFVVGNFMFGDGERLGNDTSFLEAGIIDSTGILELIMFIEETFVIKIEDDELVPANLDNLNNLSEFVKRKTSNRPG
jgi:acyl carrier protein